MIEDVPISMDFRCEDVATTWAETANKVRPWRAEFFSAFVAEVARMHGGGSCRVLELGSGPGYLAEQLLRSHPTISYVAVDFSVAMHALAKQRLGELSSRVQFIERNLRDADWTAALGQFDCVVTHQAVHELRHKRHAVTLHRQVRNLLTAGGSYLVCDHFCGEGGMVNDQLYMTVFEQLAALRDAGFEDVHQVLLNGGLVLHRAA